jgi:uncharacterized protein (TIGR02246 family)
MITKEATEARAVRDVLAATVAAWAANDADAFADLYSPDATVVVQGGVFLRGREELRDFMAAGFAGPRKGTRSVDEQESVRVFGDTAVVVSRSGVLMPGEQAVPPERLRRATWTLARHDGWWLVEAYHNCDM